MLIKKQGLAGIMWNKLIIIVLSMMFFFTGCSNTWHNPVEKNKPVEAKDFMMGTVITQKVYGENAKKAVDEVSEKLKQIESTLTINAPGGEVNKLNESAGKGSIQLSNETIYLLEKAKHFAELSNGAFDVTIGPLVKAWGVFTENPRVPSEDEIKNLLKLVDYKSIIFDKKTSSAMLKKAGQIVDLGGIAKGYAGDEAIKIYKKYGIKSACVNLGGNVVLLGNKPDGSKWRVGIRNPRSENNSSYIGIISISDKAVVTSGDYERNFVQDNKKYHHILDPKTGYPSNSGLISTTIVADLSIDADALSTATFVLGFEKGMELIESLEGVDAIFVTENREVYTTPGLKGIFEFEKERRNLNMLKKGDLVLIVVIIAVIIASYSGTRIIRSNNAGDGRVAVIQQGGEVIKRIKLDEVQGSMRLDVSNEYHEIILVENGRIRFEEADCPDKRCVKTGWLSQLGNTAVCLPNKTMITIVGDGDVDNEVDIGTY